MNIKIEEDPSKGDLSVLSQGIQSYNQDYIPDDVVFEKDTRFVVFARNNKGDVIGGIRAVAFWNYCIIELLWLSSETRGQKIGRQLMAKAESYAIDKGFEYIRTKTISFQARPFYEKLGYKVYGELPDNPKGHTTYCLIKKL